VKLLENVLIETLLLNLWAVAAGEIVWNYLHTGSFT